MLLHCLFTCNKKSTVMLISVPFTENVFFALLAFNIFSSLAVSSKLIVMSFGTVPLIFLYLAFIEFPGSLSCNFHQIWKFFNLYFSKYISVLPPPLSSGIPSTFVYLKLCYSSLTLFCYLFLFVIYYWFFFSPYVSFWIVSIAMPSRSIQFIFPPLFSTAPFHMPYFPANSFFAVYSPLFMQHIPLFIYLLFPEFLTDHKYTCTNHNPLEESIPKPPPSTDFSADQVLSPASEDTHQLLS